MLSVWTYSLISVAVVSLISLIGVLALPVKSRTFQHALLYLVSFSVGALFGDVFLHLLPGLVEETGFTSNTSIYILSGILLTFILEKFIHWRHSHSEDHTGHSHPVTTMSLVGDGMHNLIDGIIIGTSFLISVPVGIASTIAIILHEIPQEIGNFGVLLHGGLSKKKALTYNFISALTAFVGVFIALIIGESVEGITPALIAFAAGNFIYIAGADLIPELHKEVDIRKSLWQILAFIFGIAVMASLLMLE